MNIHQIMPPLKPVSGMHGLIAAELQVRAVIIATKEVRTR